MQPEATTPQLCLRRLAEQLWESNPRMPRTYPHQGGGLEAVGDEVQLAAKMGCRSIGLHGEAAF